MKTRTSTAHLRTGSPTTRPFCPRAVCLMGGLAVLTLAACGSGGSDDAALALPVQTAAPAAQAPPAAPAVGAVAKSTESEIGDVLTNADGLTLYGFTNDVDAVSTCDGTCADAWPPVIVASDFAVGPGLDVGIFATTTRDDGRTQLIAGRFPLYTFAGDAVPGDVKGQGSGEVWFAVAPSGALIAEAAPIADEEAPAEPAALVQVGNTEVGDILTDASGRSLYGFLDDADGDPTCNDACADAWPPLIVDGPDLPAGLDAEIFSVAERVDGSLQLKAGKWPLYHFAADAAPGEINGQGSGDVWFLAAPDGGLVTS